MADINIIIADDHKIFRQGLKQVLAKNSRFHVIAEAADGNELLKKLSNSECDIILTDLKMPGVDGVEIIKQIKNSNRETKIIVLTMYDDEQLILRLMEEGANGYLIKNAEPKEIHKSIFSVMETGYYFSDLVSNALLKKVVQHTGNRNTVQKEVKLNDNERNVLSLICQELTNSEIGKKLFLSSRTIEGIRSGLIEKIGARNTAGLVIYAIQKGIYK